MSYSNGANYQFRFKAIILGLTVSRPGISRLILALEQSETDHHSVHEPGDESGDYGEWADERVADSDPDQGSRQYVGRVVVAHIHPRVGDECRNDKCE